MKYITRELPCSLWTLLLAMLLPCAVLGNLTLAPVAFAQDEFDEEEENEADEKPASSAFNVAVETIVESNPETPPELAKAVAALLDFERPKLAKRYMNQLLDQDLTEEDMAQLGSEVGSVVLSRIINNDHLGQAAADFGLATLRAWKVSLRDPLRLETLAEQTLSDDPQERMLAIVELRRGGLHGVLPLVQILANANRENTHAYAREALIKFGTPAAAPLIAVLETSNDVLKQNVIRVLAQLGADNTARYLYADAWAHESEAVRSAARTALRMLQGRVTPDHEARRMLLATSREFLQGTRRVEVDVDGVADAWKWNDESGELLYLKTHPILDSAWSAARLARELVRLSPQEQNILRWQLVCELQVAKLQGGLDAPLDPNVTAVAIFGEAVSPLDQALALSDALRVALETDAAAASMAAAEIIERLARAEGADTRLLNEKLLVQANGLPAPLALALRHNDRRVQLAAASAVVALRRAEGFAGASALMGVLKPLANYSGIRRAVVADPRGPRGDLVASLLAEQGFQPASLTTGRDAYRSALASGENELILVAYTIDRPDVTRTIERLRNDARTANLPIGILASAEDLTDARRLAQRYRFTETFLRPRENATAEALTSRLLASGGLAYVPPDVRTVQAQKAIGLLDELSQRPSVHDLRGIEPALARALFHPGLTASAAKVLSQRNTHAAQLALVDFASQNALPVEPRQVAVEAFRESLKRNGVLLSYDEIKRQADRYDESEGLEKETQEVLWSILDGLQTIKKQ